MEIIWAITDGSQNLLYLSIIIHITRFNRFVWYKALGWSPRIKRAAVRLAPPFWTVCRLFSRYFLNKEVKQRNLYRLVQSNTKALIQVVNERPKARMQRWMTVDVTQKYSLDQGTGSKMAVRERFWPLRRSDVTALLPASTGSCFWMHSCWQRGTAFSGKIYILKCYVCYFNTSVFISYLTKVTKMLWRKAGVFVYIINSIAKLTNLNVFLITIANSNIRVKILFGFTFM